MARDDYPEAETAPGGAPSAFILHHTAGRGDPKSVVDFWKKQGKGYGSQYIMDRNGVIHDVAKEFGYTGTNQILNDAKHKLSNANSVGMEIVANDDKDVTPAQAQAAAAFIQARYPNLPVYGHGQVNPGHKQATEGITALNAVNALRSQGGMGTTINSANAPVAGALAEQGPESAGQSTPRAASEGPQDLRQILYNKLTGAGLQPHQALGALYSLGGESSTFNTGAYNPNDPGGSIGIGQWNGIRRTRLEEYAKAQGKAWTDPTVQADFLVGSIVDPKHVDYQPGVFDALKKTGNTADATNVWTGKFERPLVNNWQDRFKAGAARVGTLDANGQFALGSGPSSNTTSPATAVAAAPAVDKTWWEKLNATPTDAEGKPTGEKSPFEKATEAFDKAEGRGQSESARAQTEEQSPLPSQLGQGPGARNVTPGMANLAQVYGQTLNSFQKPLTWGSTPLAGSGMPIGGLQRAAAMQTPGLSLNSVLPPSQGLGYGVDDVGYGYG